MTSQGSAYQRFRRALLTGNVALIDATARELPQIALDDALRILVVLGKTRDPRYERAAARWAARAAGELQLSLATARRVLSLLEALPDAPDAVGEVLQRVTVRRPA